MLHNETLLTHVSFHDAQHAFRAALCDSFNTPLSVTLLLDLIGKVNIYITRGSPNAGVLGTIAEWIGRMLRMFGLGEGSIADGGIGWGQVAEAGVSADVSGDLFCALAKRGSTLRTLTSTFEPSRPSEIPFVASPSPQLRHPRY